MNNLWDISALQTALSKVQWNGKILNPRKGLEVSKKVIVDKDYDVKFYRVGNHGGGSTVTSDEISTDVSQGTLLGSGTINILPSETTHIYLDDLSRGGRTRVTTFLREEMDKEHPNQSRTYTGRRRRYYVSKTYNAILIQSSVLTKEEISTLWGRVPVKITSELPKPKTSKTRKKVELGKWTKDQYYSYWNEVTADTTKKAYFVRKNRTHFEDIPAANDIIKTAISLKILDEKTPIYCIPRTLAHLEKTKKWEALKDVLDKSMNEKVKNLDPKIFLRNAWENYTKHDGCPDSVTTLLQCNFKKTDFKPGTLPYEILSDAKQTFSNETQNILNMANMMKISLGKGELPYDIKQKAKEFAEKFPMLEVCYTGYHLTESKKKIIINYMNEKL
jgi:hypothetical protein